MYITFRNCSGTKNLTVIVANRKYVVDSESDVEVFCPDQKVEFEVQNNVLEGFEDAVKEMEWDDSKNSLKYRIKAKVEKKIVKIAAKTVEKGMLRLSVKYELNCENHQSPTVMLSDGIHAVFDGKFAEFFDMMPVGYYFVQAETNDGNISVVDVQTTNRKQFLKFTRNILLFTNSAIISVDWFLFLPEYFCVKFVSSQFFIKKTFVDLYKKPAEERARILDEKENGREKNKKEKGCLSSIIKVLIVLLIFVGIGYWAIISEPDVVVSEDFSQVVCFDEKFVKTDGGLPPDAEEVFLGDYTAYYLYEDGSYDMDDYHCYIYQTPDGTRYMWLKDDCSNEQNADKEYADYENPLVYKSVGEIE